MKKLNLIPNTVVQSNMRKNLRALTNTTTDTCPCKLVNNQVVFDKEVTFLDNVFAKKDIACKGAYIGEMGGVNETLASAKIYNPTIVSGPPNVQPNIKTFDGKRLLIDTNLDVSRSAAFHAGLVVVIYSQQRMDFIKIHMVPTEMDLMLSVNLPDFKMHLHGFPKNFINIFKIIFLYCKWELYFLNKIFKKY